MGAAALAELDSIPPVQRATLADYVRYEHMWIAVAILLLASLILVWIAPVRYPMIGETATA